MYSPWYVIAWRMLWLPLYSLGFALTFTAAFLMWGPYGAARVHRDLW